MALALDIVKGGFSGAAAKAIQGQVQSAVSAAGTTLATATALTASINAVTTWAASAGVRLPDCEIGDEIEIVNLGVGAGFVYPPTTSDQINGLPVGTGFILAINTAVKVKRFTATRFMAFLSA